MKSRDDKAHPCRSLTPTGAYLGGALGHGPPLWVARIAKLHGKVSKIEALLPPPFASWASSFQALGLKSLDIARKMGRNLSEDLVFALHPILGKKWDEI